MQLRNKQLGERGGGGEEKRRGVGEPLGGPGRPTFDLNVCAACHRTPWARWMKASQSLKMARSGERRPEQAWSVESGWWGVGGEEGMGKKGSGQCDAAKEKFLSSGMASKRECLP